MESCTYAFWGWILSPDLKPSSYFVLPNFHFPIHLNWAVTPFGWSYNHNKLPSFEKVRKVSWKVFFQEWLKYVVGPWWSGLSFSGSWFCSFSKCMQVLWVMEIIWDVLPKWRSCTFPAELYHWNLQKKISVTLCNQLSAFEVKNLSLHLN